MRARAHFRYALSLLLLILCITPAANAEMPILPGERPNPALFSTYRGQDNKTIADGTAGAITEQDLFLFLLMTNLDSPLLYQEYTMASPEQREPVRQRLTAAVDKLALSRILGNEYPRPLDDPLNRIRMRILTHRVHDLIWIDQEVAPQINVKRADVEKMVSETLSSWTLPASITARQIFLPVPPSASTTEFLEAESQMEQIRKQIEDEEIAFEEAARRFSQSPDASQGGLLADITEGEKFAAFDDAAFTLAPGQVSEIIVGPDGLYLIEVISIVPARLRTIEEITPLVEKRLYFNQRQHLASYSLDQMARANLLENRAEYVDVLHPDARLLRVNAVELTAADTWDLYPDFVNWDLVVNKLALRTWGTLFIYQEMIAQHNDKEGRDNDPMLQNAMQQAPLIQKAAEELKRRTIPRLLLSESELKQYVGEHPAAFQAMAPDVFTLFQVRLRDEAGSDPRRRSEEWLRLRRLIEQETSAMSSATLAQLAMENDTLGVAPSTLVPRLLENKLIPAAGSLAQVRSWRSSDPNADINEAGAEAMKNVREQLASMRASGSKFSPIMIEGQGLIHFAYIERVPVSDLELVAPFARYYYQVAAQSIARQVLEETLAEQVSDKVTYSFE